MGLTYMTGALVKAGQRMAAALTGGERWAWAPYLALWSALCAGAALGATGYVKFGAVAIWGAAVLVAVLAVWVNLTERLKV